MTLERYFDKLFVINLNRRTDRLEHFHHEMLLNKVPLNCIERFEAFDTPHHGMIGATKSHREVIRRIASSNWERALIFEDDAEVVTADKLKVAGFIASQDVWKAHCSVLNGEGNLQERFNYLSRFAPEKWDMLWLGGGYGERPIARVNKHVIRFRHLKCCAAYGISKEFAKHWTMKMDESTPPETHGAVDEMFHQYADACSFYVFQPRLIFTGKSKSDVNGLDTSYLFSMTDPTHENMV
jgi:GR25 family glycosyltransferase involved in LPS biosynthesis